MAERRRDGGRANAETRPRLNNRANKPPANGRPPAHGREGREAAVRRKEEIGSEETLPGIARGRLMSTPNSPT